MDKLRAILALLRYIPDIIKAIEPLFGAGMGPAKKQLVTDIVTTAAAGGDVLSFFIDATVENLNKSGELKGAA